MGNLMALALISAGYSQQPDPVDRIIQQLDQVSKKADRLDDKMDSIQSDVTDIKVTAARNDQRLSTVETETKRVEAETRKIGAATEALDNEHGDRLTTVERVLFEAKANVAAITLATAFFMAIFNGALRFFWPWVGKTIKRHRSDKS
jgi:septal ring factor EnvC (AmiA/AmiB activator)